MWTLSASGLTRRRGNRSRAVKFSAMRLATWRIIDGRPQRLEPRPVSLERDLEDWIARDPSIVEEGLTVIGRQVILPGVGRLDLLAVDHAEERFVVIEVKADRLHREVLAQGLDYASTIASLSGEELSEILTHQIGEAAAKRYAGLFGDAPREVPLIVVGTGVTPGLERLVGYLGDRDIPVRVVAFHNYEIEGRQVLVREAPDSRPESSAGPRHSVEGALAVLDDAGLGRDVRRVLTVAEEVGLKVRGYKRSVMITPPSNRNRALITLWPGQPAGRMFCASEAFEEFLEVPASEVRRVFGPLDEKGVRHFDAEVAAQLCEGLRALLRPYDQPQEVAA